MGLRDRDAKSNHKNTAEKKIRAAGMALAVLFGCFLPAGRWFPLAVQAGPAGEAAGATASGGAKSISADTDVVSSPEAAASVWQQADGSWYLMSPGGVPLTGWQRKDGDWYYLDAGGAMAAGWQQIDGKYYYLRENGAMQGTTFYQDDTQYSFRADGSFLSARKEKNTGGGSYPIAFFNEETQALADSLNELKEEAFDGDEEEDYYEDDKKNYDRDASFIINGTLQEIAEHRLQMARTKGYGSGRIPGEGTLSDYLKSIRCESGRRILEVYLKNCDGATAAEEKLLRNHDSDEKKRADRAVYYKEMGIAHEKVNGKDYFMVIFMR